LPKLLAHSVMLCNACGVVFRCLDCFDCGEVILYWLPWENYFSQTDYEPKTLRVLFF
jgi:hypothetical protein